jgi:branched-chain amino acid transport system permease protein
MRAAGFGTYRYQLGAFVVGGAFAGWLGTSMRSSSVS